MKYIIETFDLTKEFNGLVAVDSINLKVKEGEIYGFLGPNGAGKTTTINMLCTLLKPTKGTALVNGYDIIEQPNEVRKSIGIVPQESVLESELTARENLRFHGELYKMPRKSTDKKDVYKVNKKDRGFYIIHDKITDSVDWFNGLD